jgi:hypothetical protein
MPNQAPKKGDSVSTAGRKLRLTTRESTLWFQPNNQIGNGFESSCPWSINYAVIKVREKCQKWTLEVLFGFCICRKSEAHFSRLSDYISFWLMTVSVLNIIFLESTTVKLDSHLFLYIIFGLVLFNPFIDE